MVLVGSTTLPYVQSVNRQQPRIKQEVPLPGRNFAYRRDRGGLGATFIVNGIIYPANQATMDLIAGLADGTARIVDFQEATLTLLENCFRWTGSTWTDYTAESQSTLGTPFTLLGASTDYAFFGHREKFNELSFALAAAGTYGTLTWWYSFGDGTWHALTVTDGTSGLHQTGVVTFTPPSDWKQDTVNGVANKFWILARVASVTTPATIYNIQLNNVFLCIMLDPGFKDLDVQNYGEIPYTVTLLQQENP